MKVKAIRDGYYDLKRRRSGTVFVLHDAKLFSKNWMENLDKVQKAKKKEIDLEDEEIVTDNDVI